MTNAFVTGGFYSILPHAVVVDYDLMHTATAFEVRQDEYRRHGYGTLDYEADPVIVQPEVFHVEGEAGRQRLTESVEDMHYSESVIALLWTAPDTGHMLMVDAGCVEFLCEGVA